jgi:heavy metal translocating P-type ATPase
MKDKYRELIILAIVPGIVGILIVASWVLGHWSIGPSFLNAGLALFAALFGGWQRFLGGLQDIYRRKITVNVFVTVALVATLAIGEFRPAAIIIFIMAVVSAMESYTLDKNRQSIRNLLDLAPQTATVFRGAKEETISINEVKVGTVVIVKPGERVPVDGVVVNGASSVNQAPITGESMPVDKFKGSELFSGTLNLTGRVEARATKVGVDTMLARIVHLVEEAQGSKAPIQNLADRFTVWFLPVVLALAICVLIVTGNTKATVSILLVACPCAFAIATPTAVTAGISNMARQAVLVKGGIYFELAGKIDTLVVDKTGTFTLGRPKVLDVIAFDGLTEFEVLQLAAVAEKYSEHPLAKAVLNRAKEQGLEVTDPDEFKVEIGRGVVARYKQQDITVGRNEFLRGKGILLSAKMEGIISDQTQRGRTAILVARGTQVMGLIAIADEIRSETRQAIASLYQVMGNKNITMLTGDNPIVASAVAKQIGVDKFQAGLLPEQKQEFVKKLQEAGHTVGMIGDGINDAPALALADVGIAMGAAGTDVAIETADVTLMNDDLSRVVDFILMSRMVLRRIKLNIFFSIIYNAVGLVLGSLGMLTPIVAVIFQEAGCISVVLSSTMLLWAKPQRSGSKAAPVSGLGHEKQGLAATQ